MFITTEETKEMFGKLEEYMAELEVRWGDKIQPDSRRIIEDGKRIELLGDLQKKKEGYARDIPNVVLETPELSKEEVEDIIRESSKKPIELFPQMPPMYSIGRCAEVLQLRYIRSSSSLMQHPSEDEIYYVPASRVIMVSEPGYLDDNVERPVCIIRIQDWGEPTMYFRHSVEDVLKAMRTEVVYLPVSEGLQKVIDERNMDNEL